MKILYYKHGKPINEGLTVSDLKQLLSDLPDDLVLTTEFEGMRKVITSLSLVHYDLYIQCPYIHLEAEE